MADVVDDFGRVTRLKADFDSLSESLRSAVNKAVEYASGRAKDNTDDLKDEFEKLVEAMEELGEDVKESLKSTKDFVEEVKRAAESIEKIKSQKSSEGMGSLADAQREQTKVLHQILAAQQKAIGEKAAKFTTGGTVLSSPATKRPALKEMGFRPRGADKIPAMVSPGEFVVSKRGARGNEGLLDRINRGYLRGGKVKPAYLSGGSSGGGGGVRGGGKVEIIVAGEVDDETKKALMEQFASYGKDVSVKFTDEFKTETKKSLSTWAASIATAFTGRGDPWQTLFEGAVKDITEFRREMRDLAFQTEGITGNFREAQAEFARIGGDIAGTTGKSVTAFQKAYMNNARKGFKDQKAGMKVLESGLKLSTLIGSETQATASLFADWHRELGLSAVQMDRMANNMQMVARNTGVTGDELVEVMKSSEQILKNLRNQGTLTTTAARNVTQAMAEYKKQGFAEEGQKMLSAMSGYSAFMDSDKGTQTLLQISADRGGVGQLDMMHGGALQDPEKMGMVATGLRDWLAQQAGFKPEDYDKFDMELITDAQREQLTYVLTSMGKSIGEVDATMKNLNKGAKGLGGELSELSAASRSATATEEERKLSEKKMNDRLMAASIDQMGSVMQAVDKFKDKDMAGIAEELKTKDHKFAKDFQSSAKDLAQMAPHLSDSIKRQFGLSGSAEDMSQKVSSMDAESQIRLMSLASAEQIDKALATQGKGNQDFSKRMQAAMARNDKEAIRSIYGEMTAAQSELQVSDSANVDPMRALEQTMNTLNQTIRNTFSPLTGAVLDLIGWIGLMGLQFTMMGTSLASFFGGPVKWLSEGGLGTALQEFKGGMFQNFFKAYGKSRNPLVGTSGYVMREGRGILPSIMKGLEAQFGSGLFKVFQKALGPAVLILGGIKGAMEASEAGRTKTEGALLGALTGGAKTGSFLTGRYGDKAGAVDKTLGVAGGAAWGAMAGAAIGTSLAPFTAGLSIPAFAAVGALIGGLTEVVKIITEGTDILADLFAPFQAIGNWLSGILGDLWRILKSFATLNPVTIVTEIIAGIVGIISKTVYAFFAVIFGAIRLFVIGLPRLILRAFEMLWELPRMFLESIKNALAGLANNEWIGPIFKTLSVAFDAIYDGFMAIWTPISQIFSGLGTVFSDLGKALFGPVEGGSILSGIMWALKQAVWGLSYVISWLLSPVILLAKALGFVLTIIGKVIGGIVGAFQYLYKILVGSSIVPDLVFNIIKFFAMLPIRIMKFLAMIPIHLAKALLNLHVIIGSAIMSIGSAIMAGFKAVFVDLPTYLWNGLTSLASSDWFGPIFEPLMWVLSPLKDAMSVLYESFAEVGSAFAEVGSVLSELYGIVSEVLDSLYEAVSSVFGALYDAVSSVFSSIYAVFSPLTSIFGGAGDAASEAFGFMDVLKGAIWGLSKAIGFVLKVALFPLKLILEGLAFVIKAVANVIKGFAEIIAGIFTLDGAKIWKGMSGIGEAFASVFLWIPKMLFGMFKKIPKMFLHGLKAVFYDFPSWLMGKLMDGVWAVGNFLVLTLPKIMWQAFKNAMSAVGKFVWDTLTWPFKKIWEFMKWAWESVKQKAMEAWEYIKGMFDIKAWGSWFAGLGTYVYDGFKSALQGVWDWIKSWIPGLGGATKGFGETAEQQEATRLAEGDKISHAIGGLTGAVGSLMKGNLSEAGGKAWSATKEGAAAAWEGTKYAASYLNPFSYFKEGTKKIEKPGLGMLHEGEMVVPKGIVDKIAAVGDGAFGGLSSFFGGKKAEGGGPISSLLSFVGGKMGGGGGEGASVLSSLSDRIKGMGDWFKGCCPEESGEVQVQGVSEAVAEALGDADEGSFFGRIKKRFEDAQDYTDKFFKPLTLGFKRARKNGDGFFSSITKGLKYQAMSMSHGDGIMGSMIGSMEWMSKSIFGEREGKDTKRSILQRLKDGIFGSKEGDETKKGILDVIKNGLFGEGGEGMKKGIFSIMKEGFFGKEGEGGGLMGWFKSKVFGNKVGEGEEGPSKPGLADAAKGTAKSLWESTKRRLEINTEDGMINGAKNAAKKMYGKARDRIFGERLAEGEMGPARPGLLTKAKSKLSGMYDKAKTKLFGAGPSNGVESATEAVEAAASADSKAPGKLEAFKEKMKNIAEGIKEFSGTKVLAGALNLIPSSVGLVAMIPGSLGARMLQSIDGEKLRTSLEGLGKGVAALGNAKVLLGAAAMVAVGLGSLGLIPAIPILAVLGVVGPLVQNGLTALGKGLSAFGTAAANPQTWLGVLLLGALNLAMIPLAYAISLLSPAIEAFGKAIKYAFEGLGTVIKSAGEGISMILKEVTPARAVALFAVAGGMVALGAAMAAFAAGKFVASWINFFSGDGLMNQIMMLGMIGPNLLMAAQGVGMLGNAFKSFAANKGGGWKEWFRGSDGVVEGFKELSKIGTPEFLATADAMHKMGEGMEKIHSVPVARPLPGDATTATTPVGQVMPAGGSSGAAGVEPVHLRDITGTILRDKAGSDGNRLQSDELTRMEEASNRQVSELEQIRQGIQELVSLMRPQGGLVGSSDAAGSSSTKDPRRPMHAARFGKMKFGVPGGLANRSVVNTGEV